MNLTKEQIKNLTTKRLYNLYKIKNGILQGYYLGSHKKKIHARDLEDDLEEYVKMLKDELSTREHIKR